MGLNQYKTLILINILSKKISVGDIANLSSKYTANLS